MSEFRQEFIVTLKDYNELENFYLDMETEGTTKSFVPSRAVVCSDRRPVSRNTHYILTREEARALINDERVQSVELKIKEPLIKVEPHASQTGNWSRGDDITVGDRNWGLYRCINESNTPFWGSESIENSVITRTINLDSTGKNVDIVIVDDNVWPDHPEFGNRFVEYDWFGQHDASVRGTGCVITHVARNGSNIATITTQTAHNINAGAVINVVCSDTSFNATGVTVTAVGVTTIGDGGDGITVNTISYANTGTTVLRTSASGSWVGVYQYNTFDQENNHATHVAAIAAGNTQGWAREANIYNLRHNALGVDAELFIPNDLIFNYIREFHNSKPINPETGRRNPTIVNNSWGLGVDLYTKRNPYTGGVNYRFPRINYRGSDVIPAETPPLDTGISGVYTANAKSGAFSVQSGTASSIQTSFTDTTVVSSTTYSPNGRTGLTQSAPTFFDPTQFSENDEAYWEVPLGFNISYFSQNYDRVYVSSNSYITFGAPSNTFQFGATSPAIRKVFISTGDRSCENLWTGVFGTAGSRTFVIRWEGYEGAYSTTYETTPTTIWELKFFEATPDTFQIHIVSNANYRSEFSVAEMISKGLSINEISTSPIRSTAIDADIADAIGDGIIFVGSAGNAGLKVEVDGGPDYNNFVIDNGLPIYYQQGSSPSVSHPDAICVGSIDSSSNESKETTSNAGPRIDIYAPGRNVISAVFDSTGVPFTTITEGGASYQKRSGTSMACAQVTGILALVLEKYPFMTPAEAKAFMLKFSKPTISDTGGDYSDNVSLLGSPNRFAYYRKERPDTGMLVPKTVRYIRPETGLTYPRPIIKKT